jgi:hypothetical protein
MLVAKNSVFLFAKNCVLLIADYNYSKAVTVAAPRFHQKLKILYDRYWKYHLVVEAVGVFEVDSIIGYGHLNSNKAIFKTERILSSTLLASTRSK